MEYKPYIASTEISRIGFGAYQIGDLVQREKMQEDTALRLLTQALDSGCNYFDTAPNYGLGQSERLIGLAFENNRKNIVVNSKTGHHANGDHVFDLDRMKKSFEESLQRLNTDYIDSMILHNPTKELLYSDAFAMRFLENLHREGAIHAFGASVDTEEEMNIVLDHSDASVIEVMFNIFYQDPLPAFEKAERKGVKLIVKVPLDSGWLSGRYTVNSTFDDIRSRWSREILEKRTEALKDIEFLEPATRNLTQLALAFILHHSAVTSVIPGMRNTQQLETNLASSPSLISTEEVEKIHDLYKQKWKGLKLGW